MVDSKVGTSPQKSKPSELPQINMGHIDTLTVENLRKAKLSLAKAYRKFITC